MNVSFKNLFFLILSTRIIDIKLLTEESFFVSILSIP